jgi:hypothetical protein
MPYQTVQVHLLCAVGLDIAEDIVLVEECTTVSSARGGPAVGDEGGVGAGK